MCPKRMCTYFFTSPKTKYSIASTLFWQRPGAWALQGLWGWWWWVRAVLPCNMSYWHSIGIFICLFIYFFSLFYSPVNTQRPPCAGWASAGRSWCRWNYPTGRKNSSTRAGATKAAFAKRLTQKKIMLTLRWNTWYLCYTQDNHSLISY